jgi:hypothetical protein
MEAGAEAAEQAAPADTGARQDQFELQGIDATSGGTPGILEG